MPLLNGIEAAREIIRACPSTKVVILTTHTQDRYVLEGLQLGVKGYVLKANTVAELVDAVHAVSKGETYITHSASAAVLEAYQTKAQLREPLGVQERRVLRLIAEGKTTKEIADLLGISYKTAECHRLRLMQKLQVHSTAEVVRYAVRCGLIEA